VVQAVDFSTLAGICHELRQQCLPARLEQVIQTDPYTLYLVLKTWQSKCALLISWHRQTARLHLAQLPPQTSNTFVFAQQLWHQLHGLALVRLELLAPWERVVDLGFARRPDEPVLWHLYVEVMGKYSNVLLVNQEGMVVCLAHQVSDRQSRLRPIGTGDPYTPPPPLLNTAPSLEETFDQWCDRLRLLSQPLKDSLLKNYRGLSPHTVQMLLHTSQIPPDTLTSQLSDAQWHRLFKAWQDWLQAIPSGQWRIIPTEQGYVLYPSLGTSPPELAINRFLEHYYDQVSQREKFCTLYQHIEQFLKRKLQKLRLKYDELQEKLQQASKADSYRQQADLLTAYSSAWQAGMTEIVLPDFVSQQPVKISLDPQLNVFENAQALYKKYQKQKRASTAIAPFLTEVTTEITYLETVLHNLQQIDRHDPANLPILQEIAWELQEELDTLGKPPKTARAKSSLEQINCYRFTAPSKFLVLVGRNNWQNDQLTFQVASDYDLWFHAQEMAGSHVLLRLNAGDVPKDADLQFCADLAAWFSKGKLSDRLPVVYTRKKYIHKPKGAKLGMVIYTHETVIWGNPSRIKELLPEKQC
jgi:predicted ribosome quality control (RQC) complex YloA/Tae2 family protein